MWSAPLAYSLVARILLLLLVASNASATTLDTQPKTRSNPVIATPEAVKPQLHSGGVGYTYRIDLPPAAGIVPQLALSFSSLTGITEYGKGWSLNLSKIERSTRLGLPTYAPPSAIGDLFELDGALLARDPSNAIRFHLEQTDHRRILYVAGSDSWEVTTPDGTKFLYGSRPSANSKLNNAGRQPALPLGTFRWSLDKVIDPRGNWYEIDYTYETYSHPQLVGPPLIYNMNNHPDVIRYSYHASASAGRKRRIVDFQWGMRGEADYNDDRPTSYRSGFKIQISERLTNIVVGTDTNGDGTIDERIRRYQLVYSPKPTSTTSSLPPFSQLERIQRFGKTDADVFPSATEFEYTGPAQLGFQEPVLWTLPWTPPATAWDYLNLYHEPPWVSNLGYIRLIDMNGDGFVDRVHATGDGTWTVAYGPVVDGGSLEDDPIPWGFSTPVTWNWKCGAGGTPSTTCPEAWSDYVEKTQYSGSEWAPIWIEADLTDLDGDGLPDRVVSHDSGDWTFYRNLGDGFDVGVPWARPGPAFAADPWNRAHHTRFLINSAQIVSELVDVNGDGRPDHVTGANGGVDPGETVWVSLNTGTGFAPATAYPLAIDEAPGDGVMLLGRYFNEGFEWGITLRMFADANGDGLADRYWEQACLGKAVQSFSLGDGWQTQAGSGQSHWDLDFGGQGSDLCETGSSSCDLWPEAVHGIANRTVGEAALLDLNGDGVNDWFHIAHSAHGVSDLNWFIPSTPETYRPAVWWGLGDGTALTIGDQSAFPADTSLPPGIEWDVDDRNYAGIRDYTNPGYRVETIDINGDGLLDHVENDLMAADNGHYIGPGWHVLLHPGPSGLLKTVTNELGGVTRLTYKPSTWFRDKPAQAQTSGEGGDESHPPGVVRASSPQWLLTEITVEDGRTPTQQTQSIEYATLLYDTASREYLGARMAESLDAEDVLTRRFFHQTQALRPRLEFEEVEDATAEVVRTEKTTWVANPTLSESGTSVPGSWFPEPRETRTKLRDPGTENTQGRIVSRTFQRSTGNLLTETYWGADESLGTADDFKTVFFYSPNTTSWIVSYPYRVRELLGTAPAKIESIYYDGSGNPSTPPQQGLVTQRVTTRGDRALLEKWNYDAFGNQTKYFDPRAVDAGSTTPTRETFYETEFEAFPNLIRNALLNETEFAFNTDFGEVAKTLDANGYLRCWAYDAFGRLIRLLDRGASTASISTPCNVVLADFDFLAIGVDVAQQHILETWHHGVTALDVRGRRFFDGLGRVYQEEEELNKDNFAITVRGWGTRGEPSCESLPFQGPGGTSNVCAAVASARLETDYDALLRPKQTQRVVSGTPIAEVSRAYEVADLDGKTGNELIETRTIFASPSPHRVVQTGFDPQGRVVAVDEVGGGLTLLGRDPKGRIMAVDGPDVALYPSGSDPNRLAIFYNHLDQRTSLSGLWPAGTWAYQYDANGNLSQQTSPAGTTIRFHWDELNRLALKDYGPANTPASPGTEDVIYSYDTATNGIGRLAHVENPTAQDPDPDLPGVDTSFSYYVRGFVSSKVRDFGASGAFSLAYTFDRLGRRVQLGLPNGRSVTHTYDGSVLKEISLPAASGEPAYVVATNAQVHPSGALAGIDYPLVSGGSSYTYEPDTHRLDTVLSTASGSTVQSLDLDYDLAGNLTLATDGLGELSQSFAYDGLHRLATATSSNYGALGYSYNAAGNLLTKGPSASLLTLRYEGGAGGPHSVTRVQFPGSPDATYIYDDDGGLVTRSKDGATLGLTRDDDGRITWIPAVSASYAYDESGERSRKKVTGGSDILYADPEYEVDLASGTHKVHFFHGSRRVATENRSGLGLPGDPGTHQSWEFYFPDFVGSNAVVVRDNGQVQKSFFQPFGEFTQQGGGLTPYLFTDQEHDAESGFQYFGARYYDPWVGRFLSQDPHLIGPAPGVTFGRLDSDPQQLNAYSYARNTPTKYVDREGEFLVTAVIGGGIEGLVQGAEIALGVRSELDAKAIGVAAVTSALGFGLAKQVARVERFGTIGRVALEVASDAAVSAGAQLGKDGEVSAEGVALDVLGAQTVGKALGKAARGKAESSREGQVHERAVDRTERVAAKSLRQGRQTQASEAKAAQRDFLDTASGRAGVAGGNLVSGAKDAVDAAGDRREDIPTRPTLPIKR